MPERKPPSCPPPTTCGARSSPGRIQSAPTPGGPQRSFALTVRRSMPSALDRDGEPPEHTHRVHMERHARLACHRRDRSPRLHGPGLAVGRSQGDEARVRPQARVARRRETRGRRGPRATAVTSSPALTRSRQGDRTDACSTALVTTWRPRPAEATPLMARLFASVAPLRKTTPSGRPPTRRPTFARAARSDSRASSPRLWRAAGLPTQPSRKGRITPRTRGSTGAEVRVVEVGATRGADGPAQPIGSSGPGNGRRRRSW